MRVLTLLITLLTTLPLLAQSVDNATLRKIERAVEESPVFAKGFTGFILQDPDLEEDIYTYRADNWFTPASNAKIFTFYAATTLLGDALPALFYHRERDTLFIWGTGNPLLLHPDFSEGDTVVQWLQAQQLPIVYSDAHYRDAHYGEGWSWDDFPYGYQMEKSALPLYGNAVQIIWPGRGRLRTEPAYFTDRFIYDNRPDAPTLSRWEHANVFTFNRSALRRSAFKRKMAYVTSGTLTATLLRDALGLSVTYRQVPLPRDRQLFEVPTPDALYQQLLQESDNHIAEQLLLMASAKRYGTLDAEPIMRYVTDTLLRNMPAEVEWIDGSGLSRYNQMSPRSLTHILNRIYHKIPPSRLFTLTAVGGQSGTLQSSYSNGSNPYIFAKTGSLRHIHCLSGYLRTRSGRILTFSFMHNNFPGRTSELRNEMQRILELIYREGV